MPLNLGASSGSSGSGVRKISVPENYRAKQEEDFGRSKSTGSKFEQGSASPNVKEEEEVIRTVIPGWVQVGRLLDSPPKNREPSETNSYTRYCTTCKISEPRHLETRCLGAGT
jgi:hypothetical protein